MVQETKTKSMHASSEKSLLSELSKMKQNLLKGKKKLLLLNKDVVDCEDVVEPTVDDAVSLVAAF